jgi:hypothetical protein
VSITCCLSDPLSTGFAESGPRGSTAIRARTRRRFRIAGLLSWS